MNAKKINRGILLISILLLITYVLGVIDPDNWWATHFIYFLSPVPRYLILFVSILLIFYGYAGDLHKGLIGRAFDHILKLRIPWFGIIIVGFISVLLFYEFPIYKDYYGDAFVVLDSLEVTVHEVPVEFQQEVTSFNFRPESGRVFMLGLFNYASWFTGWKYKTVFSVVGMLFGFIWVVVWLFYIRKNINSRDWQLIMSAVGLAAPCMGVFFGHNEVYAPIYVFILVYLIFLNHCIQSTNKIYLLAAGLLLICLVRMHPLSLLLIPSFVIVMIHFILNKVSHKGIWHRWKYILIGLILPIFIMGAYYYFFIQEDYKDPRVLKFTSAQDRLFLPLISPPEPYDRYNLLSWNHIFDYLNAILFWSTPMVMLAVMFITFLRRQIDWNKLSIIVNALPVLFYASFLFVFNPLLSMPMDWDLFSLVVPSLLVLLVSLVMQIEHLNVNTRSIAVYVMAFSLLMMPFIYVNSVKESYANRLISVGVRVFKTYYEWSGRQLDFAFYLLGDDPEKSRIKQQEVLQKLRPYAVDGNDEHYAHLISIHGASYAAEGKFERALKAFKRARDYSPNHKVNLLRLLEANFMTRRYEDAFGTALELLNFQYPNERKAMRMTIHCALEAEMYRDAYRYAEIYNRQWPGDSTIHKVEYDIDYQKNPEKLKYLFSRR